MSKFACSVCGNNYFVLDYKCKNCGNILREKFSVVNLSEILKDLLFDAEIGVKKILFAERKNYVLFLFVLLSLKLTLFTLYDMNFSDLNSHLNSFSLPFKILLAWLGYLNLVFLLIKFLFDLLYKIKVNFKTIASIFSYSNIYLSVSLIILFPLELMLFGFYLFSSNPSIFEINFSKAVITLFLEATLLSYSLYLLFKFYVFILQMKIRAIFITIISMSLIFSGNYLLQKFWG